MSKLNLLELCLSPDVGGLELYMVRTAKALNNTFNVYSVISTNSNLTQYYQDSQYKSIEIVRKRSLSFTTARRLAQIIDENDIDVIHMHWTKDLPISVLAKILSKKKPRLVQTRHMNMTRFKDDFYHRFLYKKVDKILAVTSAVAAQIVKYVPDDIRPDVETLYIGSDMPSLIDMSEIESYKNEIDTQGKFIIGMVGRIEEAKGQQLLIEALQFLKLDCINFKAYFVGHAMEESYLETLRNCVQIKGLENDVVFLGFSNHPQRFMQACDVVVLATKCETFGLVLIEAMQMGTAVIATKQCGPLEIIEENKSGLLFDVNDAHGLSERLKQLYKSKSLRDTIAKSGQERAKAMFSSDIQFKKLEKIIRTI